MRLPTRRPLLVGALGILAPSAIGQEFGPRQVITTGANSAMSVHAADLDGDGDADVLSASWYDDTIAWHENLGAGTFGPQRVISTGADRATSVYAVDLDGDGDADVLSASLGDDKIAWYENTGRGTFGPQQVISTVADGAKSVLATDLDGDGDADVLSASMFDDKIAWHENLGAGSFGPQRVITTNAISAQAVQALDLDGDGDTDVLSASNGDGQIAWYENLGGGSFGPQQLIATLGGASSVYAADLNGDGRPDVLSGSSFAVNTIIWNENLGGGSFGPAQAISAYPVYPASVQATDLDRDGDADVLAAMGSKVAWHENLGGGSFGPEKAIEMSAGGAVSVYAADLNGDGETDVLAASMGTYEVTWYENLMGPIGTNYCGPANLNSSGLAARILAHGLDYATANRVRLDAIWTATNQFGMFLNSQTSGFTTPPGSQGNLCLGGGIGRYRGDVLYTGPGGAASLRLDLEATPTPGGPVAIQPGETWHFQFWYRDMNPSPTSNFTDAVAIRFR